MPIPRIWSSIGVSIPSRLGESQPATPAASWNITFVFSRARSCNEILIGTPYGYRSHLHQLERLIASTEATVHKLVGGTGFEPVSFRLRGVTLPVELATRITFDTRIWGGSTSDDVTTINHPTPEWILVSLSMLNPCRNRSPIWFDSGTNLSMLPWPSPSERLQKPRLSETSISNGQV